MKKKKRSATAHSPQHGAQRSVVAVVAWGKKLISLARTGNRTRSVCMASRHFTIKPFAHFDENLKMRAKKRAYLKPIFLKRPKT